jgi:DNA-binding transcriptional regulator YiaG
LQQVQLSTFSFYEIVSGYNSIEVLMVRCSKMVSCVFFEIEKGLVSYGLPTSPTEPRTMDARSSTLHDHYLVLSTFATHRSESVAHKSEDLRQLVKSLWGLLGLSQEKNAARLGVTFSSLQRWGNGHTRPFPLAPEASQVTSRVAWQ